MTPADCFNRHAAQGWRGKLIHFTGFTQHFGDVSVAEHAGDCDLIVFQRNCIQPRAHDAIRYWRGMGKPVVVDLDDAYDQLPWSNPAHRFWYQLPFAAPRGDGDEPGEYSKLEEFPGGAYKMLEIGLSLSDGLVAPNRLLLKNFEHVTRNSYYLQNYAEPEWWNFDPPAARAARKKAWGLEHRTVIGWGGSISHYDAWWFTGIREAARRVCRRHPEVIWVVCGNDDRIFVQLDLPRDQKHKQAGVNAAQWPGIVAGFDVGVAPLFDRYDQHRSWLKAMEYALAGIPYAATEGEPYGDMQDWLTGLQGPETAEWWEFALEDHLANLKDRQEQALALVPEARRRYVVDENLDAFAAVYKKIIDDFSDDQRSLPGVIYVEPDEEKETEDAPPAETVPA